MADEEIKIVVKEVSEGTALADAQRRKEELAKPSPASPGPNTIGGTRQVSRDPNANLASAATAGSAKKETAEEYAKRALGSPAAVAEREAAAALAAQKAAQVEINTAKAAAVAETRAQVLAEKAITKEKAEQAALSARRAQRVLNVGGQVASNVAGGLPGGAGGLLSGGGLAGIVASIVAATAVEVTNTLYTRQQEREGIANRDIASRNISDRKRGLTLQRGDSAELTESSRSAEDEKFALEQQRKEAYRKAKPKPFSILGIGNFLTGGNKLTEEGSREIEEIETKIREKDEQSLKDQMAAREKFQNGSSRSGLKFQIAQARAKRTIAGNREAQTAEAALVQKETFDRLMAESGENVELSSQGADTAVKELLRERGLTAASGIVNARSGAGDVARAAQIAGSTLPDTDKLWQKIDELHNTTKDGYISANEARTRKDFTQP